jgi:hypothetical protein
MANFVHVENGSITEYHDKIPQNWRNVSGFNLLTKPELLALGWYWVENISDHHEYDTQYIAGYTYDILTDKVVQTPQIVSYTAEELAQRAQQLTDSMMVALREERNRLLKESDWTQTLDIVELKGEPWREEWKTYRQELRDLPATYEGTQLNNLSSVTWPTEPQG